MIELTGNYKGVQYKEELVSAAQLIEMFGLVIPGVKDPTNPTDFDFIQFKLTPKYVKFDKRNKINRSLQGIMTPAALNINTDQGSLQIRYYESKFPDAKGVYTYRPPKLKVIKGIVTQVFLKNNLEKVVMLMLEPRCQTSPLKGRRRDFLYYVYDDQKLRNENLVVFNKIRDLMNEISSMSYESLRAKISGMSVNGQTITVAHNDTEDMVRSKAIELLLEAKEAFIDQWHNPNVNMIGEIKRAFDRNILEVVDDQGVRVIKFVSEFFNGMEIQRGSQSESKVDLTIRYASQNWDTFISYIREAQGRKALSDHGPKDYKMDPEIKESTSLTAQQRIERLDDLTLEELIEEAISTDTISFERGVSKIFYLKAGALDGELLEVSKKNAWKDELKDHLAADLTGVKAEFQKKVGYKLRGIAGKEKKMAQESAG